MAPNIYIKNFSSTSSRTACPNMRINEVMLRVGFMAHPTCQMLQSQIRKLPKEYQNTINKQE